MTPSKERTLMKKINGMINAIALTQDKVDNQQDRQIAKLRKEMKNHLESHKVAVATEPKKDVKEDKNKGPDPKKKKGGK
ncbi:hypothetical protein LCGC14_2869610 [marine sediment metagenome]|uniref:Uncharacterized protein n=1 Tax=marine sediment metagenome TaxID=412755 RepID=A0A0F9AUG0_9ZZZZ|nr:hypothetical protein [Desulfobacterales bacterium]